MINNKFSISGLDKHLPELSTCGESLILKSNNEKAFVSSFPSSDFIYNASFSSSLKSEPLNNILSSLNFSNEYISINNIPSFLIKLYKISKFSIYSSLSINKFIIKSFIIISLITLTLTYSS